MILYKTKRRIIQALFSLVILLVPFFNIIRLDVPTLRFYFFNTVLWVEEFYFLFLFLMLCVWLVLTFSMIYGRVWCSWMCPQMTLVELTAAIRNWLKKKLGRSAASVLVILFTALLSLIVGFNLVSYFVDPYRMIGDIGSGSLGPVTAGFIIGIALLVFIDLVFWRQDFCTKACPYAMLQTVITDDRTQLVRYHTERDHECIHCNACVKACIMGIDIRKSPHQTECTHCGDCVDACALVLAKQKPPLPTLISFSWGETDSRRNIRQNIFQRLGLFDVKRWVLVTLALVFFAVPVILSQSRQPIAVSISGDRSTLFRIGESGETINDFTLKITNRGIAVDKIQLIGPKNMKWQMQEDSTPIELAPGETRKIKLIVSTRDTGLKPGPNKVELQFRSLVETQREVRQEIVFFMPGEEYE